MIGLYIDICSFGYGTILFIVSTINGYKTEYIARDKIEASLYNVLGTFNKMYDSYRPADYFDLKKWYEDAENFVGDQIPDISDLNMFVAPIWDRMFNPLDIFNVQLSKIQFSFNELLNSLLELHEGVILGEHHPMSLPRYLIINYINSMKEDKVIPFNIIYDEGLMYNQYQSYFDAFLMNDSDQDLPDVLNMGLHFFYDERFRKYTVTDVVKAVKNYNLTRKHNKNYKNNIIERVVALELGRRNGIADMGLLIKTFDYGAVSIIRNTSKGKKYIGLVGEAHTAGICSKLQIPMILVRSGICECYLNYEEQGEKIISDIKDRDFVIKGSNNNMIYEVNGPEPVHFFSPLQRTSRLAAYGNK